MKVRRLMFAVLLFTGAVIFACNLPTMVTTVEPVAPTEDSNAPTSTATPRPTFTLRPTFTATLTYTPTPTQMTAVWNHVGLPDGALHIFDILVHPEDDQRWLVLGNPSEVNEENAIYLTTDAGATWQIVYSGGIIRPLEIDPNNADTIYAADEGKLIRSIDRGQTWTTLRDFDDLVETVHISAIDGAIYVGPRWYLNTNPGIYRSDDGGQTWDFLAFGSDIPNFILWDIEQDPNTGTLYVAIEIADHPQPYDPPFYRSTDRGETWEEVGRDLSWHGLALQVDPLTSDVYFLTEGAGLYRSIDQGVHWRRINTYVNFACDLVLDPSNPQRLIGADLLHEPLYDGGVYYSDDGGENFLFLGLEGYRTGALALNGSSTMLYVVTYEHGIYTTPIPAP